MGTKLNIDKGQRTFYYSQSGKNTFDGRSFELPRKTIQSAIDSASDLLPSPGDTARVLEAQGGVFDEAITLKNSVLVGGPNTALISGAPVVVSAANTITLDIQAIISTANNGIALKIDGNTDFGTNLATVRALGNNGTAIQITGVNENLFITSDQLALAGVGSKGIDFTGETNTPADFNFDTMTFANDNEIFFNFDPSNPASTVDLNISTVFKAMTLPTGTKGLVVNGGILKATIGSLQADTAFEVTGGILAAKGNAFGGNVEVSNGGAAVLDSFAQIVGDLETRDTGTLQTRATNIIGNATLTGASLMSIKCDFFDGQITLEENCGLFVIIGGYTGTLPIDNGNINGVINGVPFGNWQEQVILKSSSLVGQIPLGLDMPLQIVFGGAQTSPGGEISVAADGSITANIKKNFHIAIVLQYGRNSAGQVSFLFFRILVNGVAAEDPIFAKLPSSQSAVPVEFSGRIPLEVGDVITIELIRDSQGFNDGELVTELPTLAGWARSPSARLVISI